MRIMFQANAPWCTTGYGVQGKHLVPRLKALGHELAYFAFYGLQNGMLNIDGVPIYPLGLNVWGQDIVQAHMQHFQGELLISLLDVWVLDGYGQKAQQGNYYWCPWTPVDQEPVPQTVLDHLQGAHTVLPYAKHGEAQLRQAGVQNVRYIPHGVATNTFRPLDRKDCREQLGLPQDAFIIGMVAANKGYPPRKCFPEQLTAFREFKNHHPEALLYLHTLRGQEHGGVYFPELLRRLNLVEGKDVVFSDQYTYILGWAESRMAQLYNCFDFLTLTSSGEGFGIPLIEAQACGIPVVSCHNTAMTELTFAGACVTDMHPFWTPLGAFAMIPDIPAILDAYEVLYQALPTRREELAQQARQGAQRFDWDRVIQDFWKPFLEQLQAERAVLKAEHHWAGTGLFNADGSLSVPCQDAGCQAELVKNRAQPDRIVPAGFAMEYEGTPLDIEDDPQGGVAKIVCRELQRGYNLAAVPLAAGDWVVDIGAHVGVVSIALAKAHPEVNILAVEPMPANYARLLRNLQANGVTNVVAVQKAVTGDGRALKLLGKPGENSGGYSAWGPSTGVAVTQEVVLSDTLQGLLREYSIQRVKLLKLDCEGAEYEILQDGVLDAVDYLVGEFHGNALLEKLGRYPEALLEATRNRLGADKVHVTVTRMA